MRAVARLATVRPLVELMGVVALGVVRAELHLDALWNGIRRRS